MPTAPTTPDPDRLSLPLEVAMTPRRRLLRAAIAAAAVGAVGSLITSMVKAVASWVAGGVLHGCVGTASSTGLR